VVSGLRWAVIIAVALVIVGLVGGELLLPRIVAKGLEMGLGRALGEGEALSVSLKARPALKLLVGRVDELTVENKQVKAGTLAIDSLMVTVEDIVLSLRDLLGSSRRLTVSYSPVIGTVIKISEANLRRHIAENAPGFIEPSVKISADGVDIAGGLMFGGRMFVVAVEGRFVAGGEHQVDFVVDGLSLDNEPLSPGLTAAVIGALGGPELFIDLGRFPTPLVLKEVRLLEGWLVIEAQTPVR